MTYRHRQTSTFAPVLIVVILVVIAIVLIIAGAWLALVPSAVLLVAVGSMMRTLTVVVDDTEVCASMGWGWPHRRFALADVVKATAVHKEWWRGWGIRHVPRGWMYNIAGRDSVELELQSGNVFRIGTDDPDGLLAALRSASVTTPD